MSATKSLSGLLLRQLPPGARRAAEKAGARSSQVARGQFARTLPPFSQDASAAAGPSIGRVRIVCDRGSAQQIRPGMR